MSWFGCKHKHMSAVMESGLQYCVSCNRAFHPAAQPSCHVLEDVGTEEIEMRNPGEWGCITQDVIQQRCKKCGQRFTYNSTEGTYQGNCPSKSKCDVMPAKEG